MRERDFARTRMRWPLAGFERVADRRPVCLELEQGRGRHESPPGSNRLEPGAVFEGAVLLCEDAGPIRRPGCCTSCRCRPWRQVESAVQEAVPGLGRRRRGHHVLARERVPPGQHVDGVELAEGDVDGELALRPGEMRRRDESALGMRRVGLGRHRRMIESARDALGRSAPRSADGRAGGCRGGSSGRASRGASPRRRRSRGPAASCRRARR
jgi:hypothetical protein